MIRRSMKLDDRCLLFFIKSPEKGKVKSRLAAVIGDELAVKLSKEFATQMLSTLQKGDFSFHVYFYPKGALSTLKEWLGDQYPYIPQKGKNLGERMRNSFMEAFDMGFKRVVLIGSDIPDLPLEFIQEAFTSLDEKDAVIGPAYDGGYYLIGFRDKTFSTQVFEGMAWGTKRVFGDTMKVLKNINHRVHTLKPLRDVDRIEDLKHLGIEISLNLSSNK